MSIDLYRLLNPYKNSLLEVIQSSDIPFSLFQISEEKKQFTIKIHQTPLQFIVIQDISDYSAIHEYQKLKALDCKYSLFEPGFPLSGRISEGYKFQYRNIDGICNLLSDWITKTVKVYLDITSIPDRWAEIQSIQPFYSSKSFSTDDFEPFTDEEKEQLRESISEFQKIIEEEISPVKEDMDLIKEKLDYLCNAMDRLNRFDWKGVAVSTGIGIATNLFIDVNTSKRVFEIFKQVFDTATKFLPG